MDLSPKLLTDVQFREQWRGYKPDEVDEFLERVAAGVTEQQQRLAEAIERASNAERRLLERSDDDEIRRTLVLAQRTAVASMEEARTEADRLVSETEVRCRQLVAEAEAQAARLDADIATRRRMELGDLAEQRAALQLDIDVLRKFADDERRRLADVVHGQLEWLESGYSLAEVPSISDVAEPPHAPVAPVAEPASAPAPEPESDLGGRAVDELRGAREELSDALRRAGVEPDDEPGGGADAEPLQLGGKLPRPALFDDRAPDATGALDVLAEADEADEPEWRDEVADDDDPFLAELRRAVVDTEPLGPRDHHEGPSVDLGDLEVPSGGFFRRGKRRG